MQSQFTLLQLHVTTSHYMDRDCPKIGPCFSIDTVPAFIINVSYLEPQPTTLMPMCFVCMRLGGIKVH